VYLEAHHRFTAEEGDWGFTRFIELRELFLTNDKRPRPLIENDCSRVTAYVRIIKDPTGVLWHNFIKWVTCLELGQTAANNDVATILRKQLDMSDLRIRAPLVT
jgi:ubiquitin carboxyl-terminal hydrolase 7